MSISGNPLRDFSISGDAINDEIIAIPATSPYQVYPEFTPQKNSPTSTQVWTSPALAGTQYTEKTDPNLISASGDFYANYNRGGLLTFHSSAAGLSLYMTYNEVGTFMRIKHINDIRNSVGSGDIADTGGHNNLVSHANDSNIHGAGSLSQHSGDPGAHTVLNALRIPIGATNDYVWTSDAAGNGSWQVSGSGAHASTHWDAGSDEVDLAKLKPSGDVSINGYKIIGLDMPTASGDAANKQYVTLSLSDHSGDIGAHVPLRTKVQGTAPSTPPALYTGMMWLDTSVDPAAAGVAGSDTWVQFNDTGAFGANGNFVFKKLTGRVGIGTQNPVSALDVSGDTHVTNMGFAGLPSIVRASGDIEIYPNTKIGIGKAPSYKLDVNGDIQVTGFYLPTAPSAGYILVSDSSGGGTWQAQAGGGGEETLDDYTVLLAHMNGVDGSQVFVDSSLQRHTLTAYADAQMDTSQWKFGGASALFDGLADFVYTPDHASLDLGSNDFTVDFWFRNNASTEPTVIFRRNSALPYKGITIQINANNVEFYASSNGSGWDMANAKSMGTYGTSWSHFAVSRNGSVFYTFKNGVRINTWNHESAITAGAGVGSIGGLSEGTQYTVYGWIDEFRISKGVARWTADFTPPSKEYGSIDAGSITITDGLFMSGMTTGSIPFVKASGELTEDNPNLFWNDSRDRLGVGTTTPVARVDISGDVHVAKEIGFAGNPSIIRSSGDLQLLLNGNLDIRKTNTYVPVVTTAVYDSPADGDVAGEFRFRTTNSSGDIVNYGYHVVRAASVTSGDEQGQIDFYTLNNGAEAQRMTIRGVNVGIGTAAPGEKLTVVGRMRSTNSDIVVESNTKGFIVKDSQGTPHYWRLTNTAGVASFTDLGTSLPAE